MLVEITLGNGQVIAVPNLNELDLRQWRRLKELTGMAALPFVEAFAEGDPDCYLGMLTLAVELQGLPIAAAELEAENMLALMEAIGKALAEAPIENPADADLTPEVGDRNGTSNPGTIPAPTGSSDSPPDSVSVPSTSAG